LPVRSSELVSRSGASFSIIAIHGLNGHQNETWTTANRRTLDQRSPSKWNPSKYVILYSRLPPLAWTDGQISGAERARSNVEKFTWFQFLPMTQLLTFLTFPWFTFHFLKHIRAICSVYRHFIFERA